jgi:hydroxymethylpyrimidine pyrophosphatase-like HAD family hydrolase
MTRARSRPVKCSAVISDVDGTLVTNEKALTERTRAAAAALRANGILFSLISSRPPRGLRMLTAPLGITAPIVCFNGGMQRRSTEGSSDRQYSSARGIADL